MRTVGTKHAQSPMARGRAEGQGGGRESVSCCFVTHYQKCRSVPQRTLIFPRFPGVRIPAWLSPVPCSGSQKAAATMLPPLHPRPGVTWGRVHFRAPIVGKMRFLAIVGLRSPFSFWLLTRGCGQLLGAFCSQSPTPTPRSSPDNMAATHQARLENPPPVSEDSLGARTQGSHTVTLLI